MLDQLEVDCRKLNMRWIISCITDSNEESIAFHKKHGFTMYGALPSCGMKFGAWHGVVWFCRRLDEEIKNMLVQVMQPSWVMFQLVKVQAFGITL